MSSILYIHGMGGGSDSRIPNYLMERLRPSGVQVTVRTYDFDPEAGRAQIDSWVKELKPDLVIGESLGAIQALRVQNVPHLFVSPSLGAPEKMYRARWIAITALGRWLLCHHYPAREGDRQEMKFTWEVLRKYRAHGQAALAAIQPGGYYYAFFGKYDHYRRSGVVKLSLWQKHFGNNYTEYEGSHFMEEPFIDSLLIPKIHEILALQK